MAAARLSVGPVIGAHYSLHIRFLHQRLKSRKISLPHILHADLGIKFMADRLRPAVDSIMLGACRRLHHGAAALDPLYESDAEP